MLTSDNTGIPKFILDRITQIHDEILVHDPEKREDKEYYIRGTFTAQNLDFSRDVLHPADPGFREISIEPAVGKVGRYTITRERLPAILSEYERLAGAYLERMAQGKPFHFYHFKLNLYLLWSFQAAVPERKRKMP